MKSDFDLIVHKLSEDLEYINIYPLGDLHKGSPLFDEELYQKWKKTVLSDPNGYVLYVGDMMDIALKGSKTNSYMALCSPAEQKEWLANELKFFEDRLLGAVQGNHEVRITNTTSECPLYDAMAKVDLEHLYRENLALIKVNFGKKRSDRQFSYVLALMHGQSRGKVENFSYAIDGVDVFFTGHDHQPKSSFPSKIVVDTHNEVVKMVDFIRITVPSFQSFGGYVIKNMYMPQSSKVPMVTLYGNTKKEVSVTWK